MGSSYRQDLNNGMMPSWEKELRKAVAILSTISADILECIGSDGQFDNAADDGALREKLGLAKRLILEELPDEQTTTRS